MSESPGSFKDECNKLEAIVSISAVLIAVCFLAGFILFMNTRFTG